MTPERIITAAIVTSGEKHDGKQLQKDDVHIKHMDYMETDKFKELYSERYKIEAKNSELKSDFGYDTANACGKMALQSKGLVRSF